MGEESEAEPTDLDHAQRQRMESYLWWRRGGVLTIILSFFILTATLLSVSVVYDQTIRVDLTTKFYRLRCKVNLENTQEINCEENDVACMETLCPYGWTYVQETEECQLKEGDSFLSVKI